jgi:hypothetical protein
MLAVLLVLTEFGSLTAISFAHWWAATSEDLVPPSQPAK